MILGIGSILEFYSFLDLLPPKGIGSKFCPEFTNIFYIGDVEVSLFFFILDSGIIELLTLGEGLKSILDCF